MGERRSWWQQLKAHPVATILIALFVALSVLVIFGGYKFNWNWTGFNSPSKTLWDWLQLLGVLAIPVVVGFGAVWFTTRQGKVADAENTDNQRETALQAYIDSMSELLLHEKLRDSAEDEEVRKIARVRTLTILRGLDPFRKGNLVQFLQEAGLIKRYKGMREDDITVILMEHADLREAYLVGATLLNTDLSHTNLSKANLSRANMYKVNLYSADLREAVLDEAFVTYADLRGANLTKANLCDSSLCRSNLSRTELDEKPTNLAGANLSRADLTEANLAGANLHGADLKKAKLSGATGTTPEQLAEAKSLKGAIMPDGKEHD